MKAEYDFSRGVRGKYAARFPRDPVFVQFDPDISALLDGPGDLGQRLRSLLPRVAKGRRGPKPRVVRTIVFSADEYKSLKPLLTRLGGRVTAMMTAAPEQAAANPSPRRRKAG